MSGAGLYQDAAVGPLPTAISTRNPTPAFRSLKHRCAWRIMDACEDTGGARPCRQRRPPKQEIIEGLDALSQADLERVLAFMRSLAAGSRVSSGIPARRNHIDFFKQFPPFTQEAVTRSPPSSRRSSRRGSARVSADYLLDTGVANLIALDNPAILQASHGSSPCTGS